MNSQIERLAALLKHLLDTSQLSEGKLKLQLDSVDVAGLLKQAIEEFQRVSTHKILLKVEEMPAVICDYERIYQVVINLLSNAIKYSPGETTIIVSTYHKRDSIVIEVADEGYGIPESDWEKIFNRFYRVTADRMDRHSGTGLGLYISAQIIQQHGGNISVKSEIGKGSTFTIVLPAVTDF